MSSTSSRVRWKVEAVVFTTTSQQTTSISRLVRRESTRVITLAPANFSYFDNRGGTVVLGNNVDEHQLRSSHQG